MFTGDDSRLRLRRHTSATLLPQHNAPPQSYAQIKGLHKVRRRRHNRFKRLAKTVASGVCATLVSATLSLSLLPFSWTQVDYHHQVQNAASHLIQVVQENRHNYETSIRGRHMSRQVVCGDGTIGFENDNYCDCHDGRDEPMTSACSFRTVQQATFLCKSDRSIAIFASRVHDGIKDCPDGSDEY